MKRVIIESPYADNTRMYTIYAREAMLDCLNRGEAPFASHLFYTKVLDDTISDERRLGMEAGFAWSTVAELVAVYNDLGISSGMEEGMARAKALGIPVEYRSLLPQ